MCRIRIRDQQILLYTVMEQYRFLCHKALLIPQVLRIDLLNIRIRDPHLSLIHMEVPHQ